MIQKIFLFPDDLAKDFGLLVMRGHQTKFVLEAIRAKMAEPHNVRLLASIKESRAARAQHNGETGLPPTEILPAYRPLKKEVDVWA